MPSLITGDYQGQMQLNFSTSSPIYDVDENRTSQKRNESLQEIKEIYQLSASYLVNQYWQVGFTMPYFSQYKETSKRKETSRGIGDYQLNFAYEFMPEFSYSQWRPRGFLFFSQTFPTGTSSYNSSKIYRTDVRGKGIFISSLGLVFIKNLSMFDWLWFSEIHQGLSRSFQQNQSQVRVRPGMGWSSLLGLGISPFGSHWRMGATIKYTFEDEYKYQIKGSARTTGSESQYYWDTSIHLSYLINLYSFTLNYSDQSLFGPAQNTSLNRSLGFSLVRFISL